MSTASRGPLTEAPRATGLNDGDLDAAIVRAGPREKIKPLWKEPQHWVACEDFDFEKGEVLPLVVLPQRCVLRDFAMQTLKKARQPHRVAFTGSSMAGVQAAVMAGLGISIMPRSSVLNGMKILDNGKLFAPPGALEIGLLPSREAPLDIITALDNIMAQTLSVYPARPSRRDGSISSRPGIAASRHSTP